jgi:hypothetical protein
MPTFAHKFRTFCAALSLLLCVTTSVFWIRSYSRQDQLLFPKSGIWGLVLLSEHGTITLRNYGDVNPTTGKGQIVPIVPPWFSFPHYLAVILTAGVTIVILSHQAGKRAQQRGFVVESSS